ncbi:hypothetical protein [Acaryochloris sp. CCMEE 5410]|uniref:hypothetical protein n=1 Tax=Acaryochloris sp. CCMEE 5410 TaxID=310037 RepID=UPI0002484505|nr:hypothetical protein [Acaryochloris sp. CCMEE 5410]KAI9134036.1 hypothetical protein ON05_012570 [Acaryochloris sp. CCMEE 5410]
MVHLLPRDRFVIQTSAPLQTVMERLQAQIEPPKTFRSTYDLNHAPYEGSVTPSGFKMNRIPIGRPNASEPYIKGRFETFSGGTVIHLTLTPHPTVLIFVGFWSVFWYGLHLLLLSSGDMDYSAAQDRLVLPLIILVIFWISFWVEVEHTRNDLFRIILRRRLTRQQTHALMLNILRGIIVILGVAFSCSLIAEHLSPSPPSHQLPEIFQPR